MKNLKIKIIICSLFIAVFGLSFFVNPKTTEAACVIQSAQFSPSGPQGRTWYRDGLKPEVRVNVVGTGCIGKTIIINIVEDDTVHGSGLNNKIPELGDAEVFFANTNSFSIPARAGETKCEQTLNAFGSDNNDCEYYIKIDNPDGDYISKGQPGGDLNYECDGGCFTGWDIGEVGTPGTPGTPNIPPFTPVDPNYVLLAPLPCEQGSSPGCTLNDDSGKYELTKFDTSQGNSLSAYLNIAIKIIIGLSAVLAIVMIFLGGIEYMTSEVISSKEHGKERIRNAILGLLLALGAYALLNTINPDLLRVDLSKLTQATITIESEVELVPTASDFSSNPPSGAVNLCTEGIAPINTSGGVFYVCRTIATSLQSMVNEAWSQSPSVKLSGWSFRSRDNQIALRARHCGPPVPATTNDINNKPADQCHPPTARPGNSLHQSGLAIDFRCDGAPIPQQTTTNNCFVWLRNNAGRFGFRNLSSEAWHWEASRTGETNTGGAGGRY